MMGESGLYTGGAVPDDCWRAVIMALVRSLMSDGVDISSDSMLGVGDQRAKSSSSSCGACNDSGVSGDRSGINPRDGVSEMLHERQRASPLLEA